MTLVNKIDYVELYVGNALQSALYYQNIWGFEIIGFKGLETGCRDHVSYLLIQNKIKLVLTAPLSPDSPISRHITLHGDSVKNIAFEVDDIQMFWQEAMKRGAKIAYEPQTKSDEGSISLGGLKMYGDTIHTFVERKDYKGFFMPQFVPKKMGKCISLGILEIDHITANVDRGKLDYWMDYYRKIFEFKEFLSFDENDIFTDTSAINTKVSTNKNQKIKFPIIQPINQTKKSQIQEFLDYNHGAGIQHLALLTENIIETVTLLSENGVEFLEITQNYYDTLEKCIGEIIPVQKGILQGLNIMIDKENDGWIYQAFTKPLVDRPTFFIEIIERKGAKSFGKGNVKGLIQSLELQQLKRGNL